MSDLITIEHTASAQLDIVRQISTQAQHVVITNKAEYEDGGRSLVEIQRRLKEVEAIRKSFVDPINKSVKNINAFFKPVIQEWEKMLDSFKQAMLSYQQTDAAEKQRALAAAAQLASTGITTGTGINVQQYQQLAATAAAPAPAAAGVYGVEHWSWRVVDADKIPREFLGIDEVKVNAAVRAGKGATLIPGLEVFRDDRLGVRNSGA